MGVLFLGDHRWQDHRATRCTHRPARRQKSLSSELPEEGFTNSVFTIRRLLLRTSLSTSMLAIFLASRIWLRMVGISPPILLTILHKVVLLMGVGFRVSWHAFCVWSQPPIAWACSQLSSSKSIDFKLWFSCRLGKSFFWGSEWVVCSLLWACVQSSSFLSI